MEFKIFYPAEWNFFENAYSKMWKFWNTKSRHYKSKSWQGSTDIPTLYYFRPVAIQLLVVYHLIVSVYRSTSLVLENLSYSVLKITINQVRAYSFFQIGRSSLIMDGPVADHIRFALGSRRWSWKFREKHFGNPNPELRWHSSYSCWTLV